LFEATKQIVTKFAIQFNDATTWHRGWGRSQIMRRWYSVEVRAFPCSLKI